MIVKYEIRELFAQRRSVRSSINQTFFKKKCTEVLRGN